MAPHGQILIAGGDGGVPVQGIAGGRLSPVGALASAPTLAITSGYLGDVAVASAATHGHVQLGVERHVRARVGRSEVLSAASARAVKDLTLAMDFRSDVLAVWTQTGSIFLRDLPAAGAIPQIQRLATAALHVRIAALLSDDNRAIVAWSEESRGKPLCTSIARTPKCGFAPPHCCERFRNPYGLTSPAASPRLIRLSSESVMMAWAGAAEGHWVVRTAAIDLQGVGMPTTIAAPAGDALLSDLVAGPDGDALLLWTQPQQSAGALDSQDQSIFAARGFDAYPQRTVFGHPEEVAPPGPYGAATVALDPGGDGAVALWQGAGGALEYAIRARREWPLSVGAEQGAPRGGGAFRKRWLPHG